MTLAGPHVEAVDPFDLPDWLGESEVTWTPVAGIASGHLVAGVLAATSAELARELACDLLAVDEAYPQPVADDDTRHSTHQAWRHGQVHLVAREGRLTLLVPGTRFDADRVLDVVGRLAKALGVAPSAYAVHLRLTD